MVSTLVLYVFLIAGFRLMGRRQMAQLTVVDLVIITIMGSAVETAMIAGNTSLAAGLVSAATLLAANRIFALMVRRSRGFRRLMAPGPLLLVNQGKILESHLRRAGLTEPDVLEAIRERECDGIQDVRFAVLEEDGEINVVPMKTQALHKPGDIRRRHDPPTHKDSR